MYTSYAQLLKACSVFSVMTETCGDSAVVEVFLTSRYFYDMKSQNQEMTVYHVKAVIHVLLQFKCNQDYIRNKLRSVNNLSGNCCQYI